MKVVLAGYREWATAAFSILKNEIKNVSFVEVNTPEQLNKISNSIVLGAGWSWILDESFLTRNKITALVHPSDLPSYAGGTPLQHQIINGITQTKATLFEVTNDLDGGPILYKSDLSLSGNMTDVFESLTKATVNLFKQFINDYPNVNKQYQTQGKIYKRLKPEDGEITREMFQDMSALDLYNYIRCREKPYPNTFLKDKTGTLYFGNVSFEVYDESRE